MANLKRSGYWSALMLALVFGIAQVQAGDKPVRGIVGTDGRQAVTASLAAFHAIGHINVTGFRTKRRCTGTLIAPDRVVTAAHCLVGKRSGEPVPLGHIHFVAGVKGADYQAHAKAKCVHLAKTPFKRIEELSPGLLADIAVVVLDRELAVAPIPPVAQDAEIPADAPLVHPSYPRDSRYALYADFGCRLRGRKYGLWLTGCDTNFASSGGPVLVRTGERYRLAAVMAGFVKGKYTVAVPVSAWWPLLRRRTCP